MNLPRILSVDDHVVEPRDLWQRWLPERLREAAPRLVSMRGYYVAAGPAGSATILEDTDAPWVSGWEYDGPLVPIHIGFAAAGFDPRLREGRAMHYDEIHPGSYDQAARLAAMDENHTEASLCFPTFPRFCGQTFLERGDRETSLACVKAYNDWMIEEWCGGDGRGRLVPLTLIPLWDVTEAADEVRRCAAKGSFAISFSEGPVQLGLPSLYSGHWDPVWAACEETETVVNMHIGSSSKVATTGPDTPRMGTIALTFQGALHGLVDWLISGVLERFPSVKIAFSEGQVGWMPFILERLDNLWLESPRYGQVEEVLRKPPSQYVKGRVYGCIFDDASGLAQRAAIGMSQIMFETDFPHGDSTWPESRQVAEKIIEQSRLDEHEAYQLVRGNAIECYGLERFGIDA